MTGKFQLLAIYFIEYILNRSRDYENDFSHILFVITVVFDFLLRMDYEYN